MAFKSRRFFTVLALSSLAAFWLGSWIGASSLQSYYNDFEDVHPVPSPLGHALRVAPGTVLTWMRRLPTTTGAEASVVYATFTTHPLRINSGAGLRTLESLLNQEEITTHVILSVPAQFLRFPADELVQLPDWVLQHPQVTVVHPPDYGPATKYIGGLSAIPLDAGLVFVCDDDQVYHPTLLARMLSVSRSHPSDVWQNRGRIVLELGDGGPIASFAGVLAPAKVLHRLRAEHPLVPACFRTDDQWFGGFLLKKGIRVHDTGVCTYQAIFAALQDGRELTNDSGALLRERDDDVGRNRKTQLGKCAESMGCQLLESGFEAQEQPCECDVSGPSCRPHALMVCKAQNDLVVFVEHVDRLGLATHDASHVLREGTGVISPNVAFLGGATFETGGEPLFAARLSSWPDEEIGPDSALALAVRSPGHMSAARLAKGLMPLDTVVHLPISHNDGLRPDAIGPEDPRIDFRYLNESRSLLLQVLVVYNIFETSSTCVDLRCAKHCGKLGTELLPRRNMGLAFLDVLPGSGGMGVALESVVQKLLTSEQRLPMRTCRLTVQMNYSADKASECKKTVQKNWVPLVVGQDVFFVYTTQPLQVLKMREHHRRSDICELEPVSKTFQRNSRIGRVRGGTRFVYAFSTPLGEDVFWSLAHSANLIIHGQRAREKRWQQDAYSGHILAIKKVASGDFQLVAVSCPLAFDEGAPSLGYRGQMVWPTSWSRHRIVNPTSIIDFDMKHDLARVTVMVNDKDHYMVHLRGVGHWLQLALEDSRNKPEPDLDSYVERCFHELPEIYAQFAGCLHSPIRSWTGEPKPTFMLVQSDRQPDKYEDKGWEVYFWRKPEFSSRNCAYIHAPNGNTLTVSDSDGSLYLNSGGPASWDCWSWDGMGFRSFHQEGRGAGSLSVDPFSGELYVSSTVLEKSRWQIMPC